MKPPRAVAVPIALVLALLGGVAGAGEQQRPDCFGAASRDPERRCANPDLRRRVTPQPHRALLQTPGICRPAGPAELCSFGAEQADALSTIAVFGDEGARAWGPALIPLAEQRRWRGWSLTREGCPFSLSTPRLAPEERRACQAHNLHVINFLRERPEIATVFVSQRRARIVPPPGADYHASLLQGYVDAWDALPESVERVVVLREPSRLSVRTLDCVAAAYRRRADVGRECAVSRRAALRPDPAVVASRLNDQERPGLRVDEVDLSEHFCDDLRCFPVVGGVLVHRDARHMTRLFALTLAPYVARALDRLG